MLVFSLIIGVVNIVGVFVVIMFGGFGVVFWMWFIVLFVMVIKFFESVFVVYYREKNE